MIETGRQLQTFKQQSESLEIQSAMHIMHQVGKNKNRIPCLTAITAF
uniref:Uncharacterized protein n=1 Tax=Arundo donax TaxID=35708 RepID=A0A0A9FGY1_ARUDO